MKPETDILDYKARPIYIWFIRTPFKYKDADRFQSEIKRYTTQEHMNNILYEEQIK